MRARLATPALLAVGVVLALVPLVWVVQHRGRRRRELEGRADGILLLGALLGSAFAIFMATTGVVRAVREARREDDWEPVDVRLERCAVGEHRAGGRGGGTVHELSCAVRYTVHGRSLERTLTAGYPSRPSAYDGWLRDHPAGSSLSLRHDPRDPGVLDGLSTVAPATTTARSAAGQSRTFAVVALVLFLASRAVARRRIGP